MASFHMKCNMARTAGTTSSIVGIGGIAALNVASNSSKAAIAVASVGLISGIVLNLFAKSVDDDKTKECIADMKSLMDDFETEIASIQPIIEFIEQEMKKSELESAIYQGNVNRISKTLQNILKYIPFFKKKQETVGTIEQLTLMGSKDFPKLSGDLKSAAATVVKSIPGMISMIKETTMMAIGVFTADLLFLVTQMAEVVVSVNKILNEHEVVKVINEIVPKLQTIEETYRSILDQVQALRRHDLKIIF